MTLRCMRKRKREEASNNKWLGQRREQEHLQAGGGRGRGVEKSRFTHLVSVVEEISGFK